MPMPLFKLKTLWLLVSHSVVLLLGFTAGFYYLPIAIQPTSVPIEQIQQQVSSARYQATFVRQLGDSDALHWGEGTIYLSDDRVDFIGELAPGPDYRLYLTPEFAETEQDFLAIKSRSLEITDVRNFQHFSIGLSHTPDYQQYNSVLIWCEAFGQFITAAQFR